MEARRHRRASLQESAVNILVAIDGSEAARHACRLVAGYAGDRSGHQVTLINVQRLPLRLAPQPGLHQAVVEEALQGEGERLLQAAQELLVAGGWQAQAVVRLGPPADTLLECVQQRAIDLLVMGSGRQGPLRGYAVGSVALRVAAAAPCPVLLVRAGTKLPAQLGRRLRVTAPVDGSAESENAVRRLVACAAVLGEMHVDLVHFRPGLTLAGAVLPPHDDVVRQWSGSQGDEVLAQSADLLARHGIAFDMHGLSGAPDTGIAAFAREHDADLIAMATRGTGAMHHLLLGSTALRTSHVSEVPVALLR
jgi:nucleotide-binding universal stress UspA family protein